MNLDSRLRLGATLMSLGLLAVAGTATAGETVSTGPVTMEQRLTPDGSGCRSVWWIVVDDLPDVAEYETTVTGAGPTTSVQRFNKHSLANPLAGTAFDHPAPPGKVHKYWGSAGSVRPCSIETFTSYSASDLKITQFTVDPPVAGRAAIEAHLTPNGDACDMTVWASVPRIPTAISYRISYAILVGGARRITRLTLRPKDFISRPSGVAPYSDARRYGHHLRSAGAAGNGCTRLAWAQFTLGSPIVQTSASFTVTTRACFGRRPTIIAVPGRPTVGTRGNDVILGTTGRDVIRGLGGDDRICAFGGDDRIDGGPGADRIDAGAGRDTLLGGAGFDLLIGGTGRDRCAGGAGRNIVRSCP